nr:BamA/TamA family outer membrane protein [Denitromonas sp.]
KAVDVHFKVDPGPPAVYGWVGVSGAPTLDHQTVLEQSKLTPGRRFRPSDLKRARDRLVKMPSVESVRIVEGRSVDAGGGLPVNLEVIERKPRYFGATASVSTTDGAEVEAHWGHRNFFGQGEHLRVEGTVSRIGSEDISQLEFDAAAIYTKPGILDVDTDLFSEFRVTREHPDAYESMDGGVKVGLARVFNPNLSGSIALAAKFSRVDDAFGTSDYLLVSLPVEAAYDTRDNRVDATRGVSISGALIPTADTISGATFVKSEFHAAAYRSLDGDGRAVLAGRVSAGSVAGASLADVPASTRFFAGGGGSVRGYEYRSLGPTIDGEVIGGLGYVGATAELRLRVSDSFGLVPFIDFASVTDKAWPSLDGDYYVGAGLGLRYYTALGPLRIDVATPLTECDNNPTVAVYVGLGQSF